MSENGHHKPATQAEADAAARAASAGAAGADRHQQEAEDRLLRQGEETVREMRDAMATMMSASTQMMQAFIDMRLSYLKVMRSGLDDPVAMFNMMSENAKDVAKAMNQKNRKE